VDRRLEPGLRWLPTGNQHKREGAQYNEVTYTHYPRATRTSPGLLCLLRHAFAKSDLRLGPHGTGLVCALLRQVKEPGRIRRDLVDGVTVPPLFIDCQPYSRWQRGSPRGPNAYQPASRQEQGQQHVIVFRGAPGIRQHVNHPREQPDVENHRKRRPRPSEQSRDQEDEPKYGEELFHSDSDYLNVSAAGQQRTYHAANSATAVARSWVQHAIVRRDK
jgi:hypothetical protein